LNQAKAHKKLNKLFKRFFALLYSISLDESGAIRIVNAHYGRLDMKTCACLLLEQYISHALLHYFDVYYCCRQQTW